MRRASADASLIGPHRGVAESHWHGHRRLVQGRQRLRALDAVEKLDELPAGQRL